METLSYFRLSKREEEEERWCNYERYRIIVENECAGCRFYISVE